MQEKGGDTVVKEQSAAEVYRPVVRLVIALIVVFIIGSVLTSLPMLGDIWLPGMPISITSVISAIFGIILIFLLLNFKRDIVPKVQGRWKAFPEMGTVVKMSVLILIILISYDSFAGIILPFLYNFRWIYPLAFLGLAIIPIYTLGITLYRNVDKTTDLITGRLTEVAEGRENKEDMSVKCGNCGIENENTDKFCSNCGTLLE